MVRNLQISFVTAAEVLCPVKQSGHAILTVKTRTGQEQYLITLREEP